MLACLSSGSGEGPLPKIYEGGVIKERKCMLRDLWKRQLLSFYVTPDVVVSVSAGPHS